MGKFYEDNEKVSKKDWLTSLILCWFLGFFGVHRFYTGQLGTGALMLYCTVAAVCLLAYNVYLGAAAFIVAGALVLNDFLNIIFKNFQDCNGKEVSADTVIK